MGQGGDGMNSMKTQILNRIEKFPSSGTFIASDFYDIASYETIRKTLNRLTDEEIIQKIIPGFYYKPAYNELIGEHEAPDIHETAFAISRKYNWTIAPSESAALNFLGLSTQVPSKWTYISDGRYASYDLGPITIEYKRTANKNISNMSLKTRTVIQAIRALGKNNIKGKDIEIIKKALSKEDRIKLLEEGKTSSVWIYEIIKLIAAVD